MNTDKKVVSLDEAVHIAAEARASGQRVVTINGCFDILHPGHIAQFEWAKGQGDLLIVGVNSDSSVQENKGPLRPIVSQDDRARMLAALQATDYVFVFDGKSPIPWLERIRPHVHVKGQGSELSPAFAPEKAAVEACGTEVRLAPAVPGKSTTGIVEEILRRYGGQKL